MIFLNPRKSRGGGKITEISLPFLFVVLAELLHTGGSEPPMYRFFLDFPNVGLIMLIKIDDIEKFHCAGFEL